MGPYAAAGRKQSSTIKQHCTPSTCRSSACLHTAVGLHPICCKSANVVVFGHFGMKSMPKLIPQALSGVEPIPSSLLPNSGRSPCLVGVSSVPDSYGIVTGCRISFRYLSIRRLPQVMTSLIFAVREILPHTNPLPPPKSVTLSVQQSAEPSPCLHSSL